ncbi:MAG: DUF4249 domain-containing protein [Prolixibacteraceae bacterium]|nr:DUF4249 domain-containing protein [Prolixibacteraceae bacterium]
MKQIILFTILIGLLMAGCREEVKFNDENIASKMVVNSFIDADSTIKVSVAGSKPIPGVTSNFNWINDATIKLFVDGKETETLKTMNQAVPEGNDDYYEQNYTPNVIYYSETKAKVGKTYKLEINHKRYGLATCETTIPEPIQIISIDTMVTGPAQYNYENNNLNVKIKFKDPANEANYYRLIAYINQGIYREKRYQDTVMDSVIEVRENYLTIYDPVINPEQEDANDFLFGSPRNPYNVFSDELIDGREYTINFDINIYNHQRIEGIDMTEKGEFHQLKFILQSITPETYLFLKSSYLHHYYDGDLFAEPVQVFSNVENGLGILGGQSNDVISFQKGNFPVDSINYHYGYYNTYYYSNY